MILNIWSSLDANFTDVFNMSWPMIVISVVLLSTLRFSYLIKNKDKFVLHNELLMLFFVIYILCLFQVVTFQDVTNIGTNNFIPFKEIFRYDFGGRLFIKNIVGNMIMFVPYGFFVSHFSKLNNYKQNLFLVFIASLAIEFTQLAIGRVFDVDDIILNVIGGSIGILSFSLLNKLGNICPKVFKSKLFLDIITMMIFFLGAIYIVWR